MGWGVRRACVYAPLLVPHSPVLWVSMGCLGEPCVRVPCARRALRVGAVWRVVELRVAVEGRGGSVGGAGAVLEGCVFPPVQWCRGSLSRAGVVGAWCGAVEMIKCLVVEFFTLCAVRWLRYHGRWPLPGGAGAAGGWLADSARLRARVSTDCWAGSLCPCMAGGGCAKQ